MLLHDLVMERVGPVGATKNSLTLKIGSVDEQARQLDYNFHSGYYRLCLVHAHPGLICITFTCEKLYDSHHIFCNTNSGFHHTFVMEAHGKNSML